MAIIDVKTNFNTSLGEAKNLYRHCLSPVGPHTKPGIEAAFLQLQSSWEVFLESLLLEFLCGGQPLTGGNVTPHFTVANIDIARSILYQERPFCEWTNVDNIFKRFSYFLGHSNRVETHLTPIIVQLREITKVRNAVAHSSLTAQRSFYNVVQSKIGGTPPIARPADFLSHINPADSPNTFFDYYAVSLEIAALNIVG